MSKEHTPIVTGSRIPPAERDATLAEFLIDVFGLDPAEYISDVTLVASYGEPAKLIVTYAMRQDMVEKLTKRADATP